MEKWILYSMETFLQHKEQSSATLLRAMTSTTTTMSRQAMPSLKEVLKFTDLLEGWLCTRKLTLLLSHGLLSTKGQLFLPLMIEQLEMFSKIKRMVSSSLLPHHRDKNLLKLFQKLQHNLSSTVKRNTFLASLMKEMSITAVLPHTSKLTQLKFHWSTLTVQPDKNAS